jgi:hypothetical protein
MARRTNQGLAVAIASFCLIAGGTIVGGTSLGVLAERLWKGQYGQARRAIREIETLAEDFRERQRDAARVLSIQPEPTSAMVPESQPMLLIAYFAGTSLPWPWPGIDLPPRDKSDRAVSYPRDKLFSMIPKRVDYAYLPESALRTTSVLLHGRPLSAVPVSATERYYLFATANARTSLKEIDEDQLDALGAILRREYPALVGQFDSDRFLAKIGVRVKYDRSRSLDRVGCGPLALEPDGRPDLIFVVEFVGNRAMSTSHFIESIAVEREQPAGVWVTGGVNYVLGVAPTNSERLLNRPDGSVKIALEPGLRIRLLACDDGAGTASSSYRVHLRIDSGVLDSPAVSVNSPGS